MENIFSNLVAFTLPAVSGLASFCFVYSIQTLHYWCSSVVSDLYYKGYIMFIRKVYSSNISNSSYYFSLKSDISHRQRNA